MKSKLLLVMFTLMTCLLAQQGNAQVRYQDSMFATFTIDTVLYSSVYNLKMNVYQPVGDANTSRPVVVLAHGGTFISGTRTSDVTVTRLCADLVKKGYVTISIDYRLSGVANMLIGDSAALEVFKAVGDCKAAIRYLYMDVANGNTYKIDTNNIFIGGNSAGAVLAMHYAYIDSLGELNDTFQHIVANTGGLEGNSGNAGYSSNVKGVVSLAGGLNQAWWMGFCSKPIVSAQGSADPIVPYTCAEPFVFGIAYVPLQLCGLGSYQFYANNNVPYYQSIVFPGQQHVPWDTSAQMYYQVDTIVTGFLYKEVTNQVPTVCSGWPAGIQGIGSTNLSIYPNPATNILNIHSTEFISNISVADEMGRTVSQVSDVHALDYQLNTSHLSSGIYFLKLDMGKSTIVKKVTIE